jgi:hypothetical protein
MRSGQLTSGIKRVATNLEAGETDLEREEMDMQLERR